MIFESYSWKQDLKKRKKLIKEYNTIVMLENKGERVYTTIEKAIFYSAFIIRKLIDSKGKMSDEVESYSLNVRSIQPIKHIDLLHRWLEEDSYDWESEREITVSGKNVCNWLIHSYIFFVVYNENGLIDSFCVSSDYDKNKILYRINIEDWIEYMDFVSSDDIISMVAHYDENKKDYFYLRKKRGELRRR